MSEGAVVFDSEQRLLVEKTIRDHCVIRKWELYAVNCRTDHVHVVVGASDRSIEIPREQFKSWATRKLKMLESIRKSDQVVREHWWSDRGWDVYVDTESDLDEVTCYVNEEQ